LRQSLSRETPVAQLNFYFAKRIFNRRWTQMNADSRHEFQELTQIFKREFIRVNSRNSRQNFVPSSLCCSQTGIHWQVDLAAGSGKITSQIFHTMPRPVTLFTGQWADLSLAELLPLVKKMGYDGVELACWGDHFEVDRALAEPDYVKKKWALLQKHGLNCFAISNVHVRPTTMFWLSDGL